MTENVRMFTAKQAATYLSTLSGRKPGEVQVNPETVRRAYRAGRLRGVKDGLAPGSPVRYTKADLDAYFASRVA
jgi:hypothetical protein